MRRLSPVRCQFIVLFALIVTALLGGCSPAPLRLAETDEPQLHAIHAAFGEAVDAARNYPDLHWHSGWLGNAIVNLGGKGTFGLCHHWQEWIYREVLPAVHEAGWEACGIAINAGTSHEHHAVIVFDPRRIVRGNLLAAPETTSAYVLDAWRRGRPDIYRLSDWLEIPLAISTPAQLEELPGGEILPARSPRSMDGAGEAGPEEPAAR